MTTLSHLAHVLGFVLWLGGGLAGMVIGLRGRSEDRVIQGAVTRLQAALNRRLMVPGALLTVISGIYLSIPAANAGSPSAWLMVMQGAGLIAALLVLFVVNPTIMRLAHLDPIGETAALFDRLRRRHTVAAMIAGNLGLLSLIAGVLHRY